MARSMHPGQRNSLDALCRRYAIDNSHRELHGALLDARLLVDVYLAMTGGQVALILGTEETGAFSAAEAVVRAVRPTIQLIVVRATDEETQAHERYLGLLDTADITGAKNEAVRYETVGATDILLRDVVSTGTQSGLGFYSSQGPSPEGVTFENCSFD